MIDMRKNFIRFFVILFVLQISQLHGSSQNIIVKRNKPEKVEWFIEQGFGMFIHWSLDVQVGAIISHNVAVGSKDYQDYYFNELPKTFDPKKFDPEEWAKLAYMAGMKYMVFTAKHHNGFCMWDTKTSDYKITNTPFGRDALKEIIEAFRKYNIAIGLYFSPDDYHVMYKQGYQPSRTSPESESPNNEELWKINQEQLKELIQNYGGIDLFFLDEKSDWVNTLVANYIWDLDEDILITRGGMATPEQYLPNKPIPAPWEACYTIGEHWQYVAEEPYKDATELIYLLIETRAKGGNLLLNVGPDSYGEIPPRQESRLREMALWKMANHEAIYNVKPFEIVREEDIWFTQSKDEKVLYAFLPGEGWNHMERKTFNLPSIRANENTAVTVLGQNDEMMEYDIQITPKAFFSNTETGLMVSVIKGQRLNKTWDNPVVIKIENYSLKK